MKIYLMILFLLAGLSNYSLAQKSRQEGPETITKKRSKSKKQMSHFEKQRKDRKIEHNGTAYRKAKKYVVDDNGFKSFQPLKKDRNFMYVSAAKKKRYQKRLERILYAGR